MISAASKREKRKRKLEEIKIYARFSSNLQYHYCKKKINYVLHPKNNSTGKVKQPAILDLFCLYVFIFA